MIVALFGPQLHRNDVGAGGGLGHGKRADMFARDQLGQVFLLLLLGAIQLDLVHAEVRMRAVAERDGGRGAGDFFHGDDMGEVGHARAAILFVDGDSQKAELPHLGPELCGKEVLPIDLGGDGGDPLLRPAMHHVAQRVHLVPKIK